MQWSDLGPIKVKKFLTVEILAMMVVSKPPASWLEMLALNQNCLINWKIVECLSSFPLSFRRTFMGWDKQKKTSISVKCQDYVVRGEKSQRGVTGVQGKVRVAQISIWKNRWFHISSSGSKAEVKPSTFVLSVSAKFLAMVHGIIYSSMLLLPIYSSILALWSTSPEFGFRDLSSLDFFAFLGLGLIYYAKVGPATTFVNI